MIEKPSYQLAFNLDLAAPEEAQQGWVSPEEAAAREEAARKIFEDGNKPAWYEEYERLVYGGWPFRVAVYIAWAACPRRGRQPEDLAGLASLLGLKSPRAIHTWKQRNPEIERQVALMQAAPLFKHRADIFDALAESAKTPDYRHAPDRRTALTIMGDLADDNANVAVNVTLTGDDLAKARKNAQEWERSRFGDDDPGAVPVGVEQE